MRPGNQLPTGLTRSRRHGRRTSETVYSLDSRRTRPLIGILIFPDFQLLDAAGPISVFEIAARYAGRSPSIRVLAATPGPGRTASGVEMLARGLKAAGSVSTLIVAGGEGVDAAAKCKTTLAFVQRLAKRG